MRQPYCRYSGDSADFFCREKTAWLEVNLTASAAVSDLSGDWGGERGRTAGVGLVYPVNAQVVDGYELASGQGRRVGLGPRDVCR